MKTITIGGTALDLAGNPMPEGTEITIRQLQTGFVGDRVHMQSTVKAYVGPDGQIYRSTEYDPQNLNVEIWSTEEADNPVFVSIRSGGMSFSGIIPEDVPGVISLPSLRLAMLDATSETAQALYSKLFEDLFDELLGDASEAVEKSQTWAEGEDAEVAELGGTKSSKGHAQAAGVFATAAATDSAAADTAKQGADTARDKAEAWAETDEDVEVEPGQFSSLHHAAKAAGAVAEHAENANIHLPAAAPVGSIARRTAAGWEAIEGDDDDFLKRDDGLWVPRKRIDAFRRELAIEPHTRLLHYDTFHRPNGAPGNLDSGEEWEIVLGDWQITDKTVTPLVSGDSLVSNNLLVHQSNATPRGRMQRFWRYGETTAVVSACFSYTDANNYWYIHSTNQIAFRVYQVLDGDSILKLNLSFNNLGVTDASARHLYNEARITWTTNGHLFMQMWGLTRVFVPPGAERDHINAGTRIGLSAGRNDALVVGYAVYQS